MLGIALVVAGMALAACGGDDAGSASSTGGANAADGATTSTQEGTTSTTAEASGGSWAFDLTTDVGWTYHVSAKAPIEYRFSVDVTNSPPGKAQLVLNTFGSEPEFNFVPATPGRSAPDVDDRPIINSPITYIAFHVPSDGGRAPDMLSSDGNPVCTGYGASTGYQCRLVQWALGEHRSGDIDEQVARSIATSLAAGPAFTQFRLDERDGGAGFCDVKLLPDGSATTVSPCRIG